MRVFVCGEGRHDGGQNGNKHYSAIAATDARAPDVVGGLGPAPARHDTRCQRPNLEKAKPRATPAEGTATERTRRHTDPPAPKGTMWTPDRVHPKAHLPAPDGTMSHV